MPHIAVVKPVFNEAPVLPERIPELAAAWRSGSGIVLAVRRSRKESRVLTYSGTLIAGLGCTPS
jgi:hypothetical protein